MRVLITEDERWPTLLVEEPTEKMMKMTYWNQQVVDIDESLISDLAEAHKQLEAAENAVKLAMGQEVKEGDSWYFSK